ncbi:MAG: response regulator transcription factor [Chloroflexi bacterium]|nr:response regulator transcription factor [Chloroflexota bacterium]
MGEGDVTERIRVVLAEDHAVMREGTRLILEAEEDIEVVAEADDGKDAVRLCAELMPDVIVLDIKLKEMNGVEVAKQIRVAAPRCSVLVLTAYDYEQYVKAMLRAGAKGYLLKSASGREVVEAVRLVSVGGSAFSAAITRQIVEELSDDDGPLPHRKAPPEDLSDREFEVLRLLARGARNVQIAEELSIAIHTVESHVRRICAKLTASSRGEAVLIARQRGLLDIDELMA